MHVLIEGSGGTSGWPEPGCRCASCLRAAADGNGRKRSTIVIDGVLRLEIGDPDGEVGGSAGREGQVGEVGCSADGEGQVGEEMAAGFLVRRLADGRGAGPGGWEVTSPGGERLLYPAGAGAVPDPPEGTERYDIAFLDLLGDPNQLGRLRARGLITVDTITVAAFADHRVNAERELERRCGFWRVGVPHDGDSVTMDRSAEGFEGLGENGRRLPWRVLLMGGARSGKSEQAELRLAGEPDVTYVATGPSGAGDPDWAARVAVHRARRPGWWRTVETSDLAGVLASARGAVLIDGIGTWLTAALDECGGWGGGDGGEGAGRIAAKTAELISAWRQTWAYVVAVSDEAGLGVVPATAAGRLFRDELGRLNQALAAESEEIGLVIAGRVLPLPDAAGVSWSPGKESAGHRANRRVEVTER
jgi:adenosylcobinamide kinase/adenosylcobinamide-phosphate guanylyltransferase